MLFCTLQITQLAILHAEYLPAEIKASRAELCDAPPPDSFRVASRGPSIIVLAWNPAWDGATHMLTVLTKLDSVGGESWIPQDTFLNIPGSSFAINNAAFDTDYKFIIATICSSGETSIHQVILTPKIILELQTGGRIPVNPQISYCDGIILSDYEWVGFKVNRQNGSGVESNFFELKVLGDANFAQIQIKRGPDISVIYAVDELYKWPAPTRYPDNPFPIIKFIEGTLIELIGEVEVTVDFETQFSAHLCSVSTSPPWNSAYDYTVYVADAVMPPPSEVVKVRSGRILTSNDYCKIKVQSPFSEVLNISFTAQSNQAQGSAKIRLFSTNGQPILDQQFDAPVEQLSLHVGSVPPGIYVLHVETDDEVKTMKVIKLD